MKGLLVLILLLSMEATICFTARILAIFPLPFEEKQLVYRSYINGLAKHGHDIVVMTTNPINIKDKEFENIKEISVEHISYKFWDEFMKKSSLSKYCGTSGFKQVILELIDLQFSTSRMKSILQNEQLQFNLVIVESMLPALYSLGYKFGAPVIGVASQSNCIGHVETQRHPGNKMLYNDFIISQNAKKNFLEKLTVLTSNLLDIFMNWISYDQSHVVIMDHLGSFLPIGIEYSRQMSSLLLSFQERSNGVKPLPPAVISVGSHQFSVTPDIDKELKHLMDHSRLGFIYVNTESFKNIHNLPSGTMKMFLRVFDEIRFNVLLMWPNDTLPGQPDNVYISKSFPQRSILGYINSYTGHPNIKAFIMQSKTQFLDEAIFHKVPVIAISVPGEQEEQDMQTVNEWNIGEIVDIQNSTKKHFKSVVLNVASNSIYRANLNKIWQMRQDAPQADLVRALWWTEYVLRHNGIGHLRTPIVSHYEYLMLDIISFMFLAVVIILSLSLWTILTLFPRIPS